MPAHGSCERKDGQSKSESADKMKDKQGYTRFSFTLFSMLVSSSFLSGYSVTTFYLGITYMTSGIIRGIALFNTWMGFQYEITHPQPIEKVCEACYLYRFEQDLYKEEECYRMLQEIIRSPDLMKNLTGTCLRGAMAPKLD